MPYPWLVEPKEPVNLSLRTHPAYNEMREMWREGHRATAIVNWLVEQGYPPLDRQTLGRHGQRYWTEPDENFHSSQTISAPNGSQVDLSEARQLVEQVRAAGLGRIQSLTVGSKQYPGWQRATADQPATSVINESSVRTLKIVPDPAPETVLLDRAPSIEVTVKGSTEKPRGKPDGWRVGVFLPDMQIGFHKVGDELEPTHDEAALDVAHQIMADLEAMYGIDVVVNAGDNVDLPDLGKHRSAPGHLGHIQHAIDRTAQEAGVQRSLAQAASIWWLPGNHEQRLTNFLADKAAPLLGVSRAGEEEPVLSLAYLCRFDEYDIRWVEGWPAPEVWVSDRLKFEHGHLYSSVEGGTAVKYLKTGVSVGYGHIHRSELLWQTRSTAKGAVRHFAGSPGCLARIDGVVPSAKSGIDSKGRQVGRQESWQQGLWVFWFQPEGDQLVDVEPVHIFNGSALWRGKRYEANVDVNGKALP